MGSPRTVPTTPPMTDVLSESYSVPDDSPYLTPDLTDTPTSTAYMTDTQSGNAYMTDDPSESVLPPLFNKKLNLSAHSKDSVVHSPPPPKSAKKPDSWVSPDYPTSPHMVSDEEKDTHHAVEIYIEGQWLY